MTHIPLRLCVGCGRVFDEIQPKDRQPQWMDAHAYLTKYGFHWEDLDRTDDACPLCARVFAIARRRVHPEMTQATTVS
jgi:rubredoxin